MATTAGKKVTGKPTVITTRTASGKPEIIKPTRSGSGGGLKTSTKTTWMEKATTLITEGLYNDYRQVTGEQIRFWLRSKRLRAPAHPNAYGALILRLVQQGILRKTQKFAASEAPTSHGRQRRVYAVSARARAKKTVG